MPISKKTLVYAYGFDKMGFQFPEGPLETASATIHCLDYSTRKRLDEADGVIIASGIFERFGYSREIVYSTEVCESDVEQLAARESQCDQLLKDGGWIACLLGEIRYGPYLKWKDTDLAKRLLRRSTLAIQRYHRSQSECVSDEFREYLRLYGICQTVFEVDQRVSFMRIARLGKNDCGGCIDNNVFFLPFMAQHKEAEDLTNIVKVCANSILSWRQKHQLVIPPWAAEIEFAKEKALISARGELIEQVNQIDEELFTFAKYRGLVCTSGEIFCNIVVEVMRRFFGLDFTRDEEFKEDALLVDNKIGRCPVEMKGVKGGLKREHINQVDSHRERLDLDHRDPGLLIINDFNGDTDLTYRRSRAFDAAQLGYASKQNVKILRAITLIEIIESMEKYSTGERGQKFIDMFLAADPLITLNADTSIFR